jgi:uncharacterized membrane protein YedE/YeeE
MQTVTALVAGIVFGLGLIISGMVNPTKVQNFLDIFGTWDPSLAFVMGGAIAVTLTGFRLTHIRAQPFFHDVFHLPDRADLDARLLAGAAIFGVGWGMGGYCPGPAITGLPLAATGTLVFMVTMLIGMLLAKIVKAPAPLAEPVR